MRCRIIKSLLTFVITPILLMTACGQQGAFFSILPTGQSFQGSIQSNKIDVLWVIDNSGSMLTKQQALRDSFDDFMTLFTAKNYDFRMAIVTTDTYPTPGGQNGNFQGVPTVLTNTTPAFAATFKANVVVGAVGASDAMGLDAINLALSPAKLAGPNTGFLRSDAHLVVIVVSDADDTNSTTATATSTYNFLKTLKPDTIDAGTGRSRQAFSVHAVMDDQSVVDAINCVGSEDGIVWRDLTALAGGSKMDICANNFSAGLANLSEQIASFISQVLLKQTPYVDTIQVTIDGIVVPQDATNGWTYEATGNKLVFHGSAIPSESSQISVMYVPTDIIR